MTPSPSLHSALSALALALLTSVAATTSAQGTPGDVLGSHVLAGGANDDFGGAVAYIGDLDGDRVSELAIGLPSDSDGGVGNGAIRIYFMNDDGSVKSSRKISATQGGFSGAMDAPAAFGSAVVALGDVNKDGVPDIAVGAPFGDRSGPQAKGLVFVLALDATGSVVDERKIGDGFGGFSGDIALDEFGASIAVLGSLNGNGVPDLAVGAPAHRELDGGPFVVNKGSFWLLKMRPNGTVKAQAKITPSEFPAPVDAGAHLGRSLDTHDLDGDGDRELIIGGTGQGVGGAIWIADVTSQGTVNAATEIRRDQIGGGALVTDAFGSAVAAVGDLDGDGFTDLAVGSSGDNDGPGAGLVQQAGAVWILMIDAGGQVLGVSKISNAAGNLPHALQQFSSFGASIAARPAKESPCPRIAVGAPESSGTLAEYVYNLDIRGRPFIDIGHGHPGSSTFEPVQRGTGSLVGGTQATFELSGALANTDAWLVISTKRKDTPFMGGVMVPKVQYVVTTTTDASGRAASTLTWPTGFAPCDRLYSQYWVDDPLAFPAGAAASNALLLVAAGD